ncbi:capsular polysaccharide biosynthesis protein [Neisseria chenwenguii]|uniref:Beta-3-deoxy-D-manno-oct-2-ulosonic acid transferase n=1 Tax=Neisseria chenwenguii TaxID=1853278 RepID=A0A220S2W1_9NEIS|nr:capsular polysaccharide biosynthesis protein [Neisseria chenwenguii]ASK27535.1 beta-3-deoxy-D-manno-oct-2-ulosonic acid transferase [Neisseria chenwenguii]ROV55613.1 capsular polysaccharide biosynthesis protein [Neisseria chenwenguii]
MKPSLIFSHGIAKIPHLQAFLPECRLKFVRPFTARFTAAAGVIGWGLRPTTRKARAFAAAKGLPFTALEDGFLRSVGLGVAGYPPFSVVVDDMGIYYDTTRPSRLEQLILNADTMPSEMLETARRAAELILAHGLSKYNHAPDCSGGLKAQRPSEQAVVLVIDQTFGDMAVQYGRADEAAFEAMFQTALRENPEAQIWVKTHPDVLSGKKRGYLTAPSLQSGRVKLMAEDMNPTSLLRLADKVYCVTSQMGFEALLCGKPVVTFGLPWYAGWGMSDDRHPQAAALRAEGRRAPRSLMQLFAAAYLQYSRYINPNTGEAGDIFDVIDYLAAARRANERLRGEVYCVGMSLWKRAVAKPFFRLPSCRLKFVKSVERLEHALLPPDARLLAWGNGKEAVTAFAARRNLPLLRMEDGFIRSVGLGSNLVPPLSLVVDDTGIYFNPETPSRLELILQNQIFTERDVQTALLLQKALTENHISKYNVGSQNFTPPQTDKTVILVPGQVEDDASVRHGSPEIRSNLDLLKAVRARNPDAYIIYKPHPDVVSGNRIGQIAPADTARYADQVAAETDILTCLQHADEVHTMTSLTGFEALLRGKKVSCYGLPFYAGWGLTDDLLPLPRRTRRLKLAELIAGTLVYYPGYVHPETRQLIDAATAVGVLKMQKELQKNNTNLQRSALKKQWGKLVQLYRSLL